jgi:hypothetical protein
MIDMETAAVGQQPPVSDQRIPFSAGFGGDGSYGQSSVAPVDICTAYERAPAQRGRYEAAGQASRGCEEPSPDRAASWKGSVLVVKRRTTFASALLALATGATSVGGAIVLSPAPAGAQMESPGAPILAGPGWQYATLASLPAGAAPSITGDAINGFLPVTWGGIAGWIDSTAPSGDSYVIAGQLAGDTYAAPIAADTYGDGSGDTYGAPADTYSLVPPSEAAAADTYYTAPAEEPAAAPADTYAAAPVAETAEAIPADTSAANVDASDTYGIPADTYSVVPAATDTYEPAPTAAAADTYGSLASDSYGPAPAAEGVAITAEPVTSTTVVDPTYVEDNAAGLSGQGQPPSRSRGNRGSTSGSTGAVSEPSGGHDLRPPSGAPTNHDGNTEYSDQQIIDIIHQAAAKYGQSPQAMVRVARCESGLNPYAIGAGQYYGLFQFVPDTFARTPYGDYDIFDPWANAHAAAWMWEQGQKSAWVCQ